MTYQPSWLVITSPEHTYGAKYEINMLASDLKRLYKIIVKYGDIEKGLEHFKRSANSSDMSVLVRNVLSTIVSGELDETEAFEDRWHVHEVIMRLQHEEEILRLTLESAEHHLGYIGDDEDD